MFRVKTSPLSPLSIHFSPKSPSSSNLCPLHENKFSLARKIIFTSRKIYFHSKEIAETKVSVYFFPETFCISILLSYICKISPSFKSRPKKREEEKSVCYPCSLFYKSSQKQKET